MVIKTAEKMWTGIPACLPDPEMTPESVKSDQCWMVGIDNDDIYQVQAQFISDENCEEIWTAKDRVDYSSQFCAKAKNYSMSFFSIFGF